jgi:hypothetical protein
MTLIVKKKNLKFWGKKISKENESAYVGTNYRDEPTLNAETKKLPSNNLNNFQNQKNLTSTMNGSN